MLRLTIPAAEMWDEGKQEFVNSKEYILQLEHSLVSLRKWESKFCKPFFQKEGMTNEETIYYIKCMTMTQNVPDEIYNNITDDHVRSVEEYINAPMTATWFTEDQKKGAKGNNGEMITAELIYYWMTALNIPFECQKWHLNSLLTLIRVCNVKNQPPKKMGKKATMSRNAALNAARRKQFNTNG